MIPMLLAESLAAPAQAKRARGAVSEPRVQVGAAMWLVWIRRRRRRDPSPLIGPPGSAPGPLPLLCLSDGDAGARAKGLAARAWSPLLKLLGLRHVLHDCYDFFLRLLIQITRSCICNSDSYL